MLGLAVFCYSCILCHDARIVIKNNCILIWSYPLGGSYMLHMHGTCMSMIIIISGLHTSWIHKIMYHDRCSVSHMRTNKLCTLVAIFEPIKYATEHILLHVWWLSWLPVSLSAWEYIHWHGGENSCLYSYACTLAAKLLYPCQHKYM